MSVWHILWRASARGLPRLLQLLHQIVRQVLHADHAGIIEQRHRGAQRVVELAQIAWPGMLAQHARQLRIQFDRTMRRMPLQHALHQRIPVAALAQGRLPEGMAEDEAVVHAFCTELLHNRGVSDPTWERAVARFGEHGVVDLIGVTGYYALLSMLMNASRTEVPASSAAPLPDLTAGA